jgi:hypothetical protein
MSISSVYINSGTWSGSDIITGINVRNSKNNIHIIDDNSVIVGLTTDTQAFTDSGSGYLSQNTYSNIGDIIGFDKEFILGDDLYIYNSVEPTLETRWVSGTDTKYSVNLGSLGNITNATFTSGINAIEALNEIRNSILALNINNLSISLPNYINDVSPNNNAVNLSGYGIIVNTGTYVNENTSFAINDLNADGLNIIHNYEYETDGGGIEQTTTISLTEPDGTGTLTLSVSANTVDDDQSNSIGNDLIDLINNNTENPNDYSATYDNITKTITFTGITPFDSNINQLWTATVNNGTITGDDEGNISFGTSSIKRTGVLNETFTITAPDLYSKTINGSPLFSKITFTGGSQQTFSNNLNAIDAAIELKNELNSSLSGYINASIDSLNPYKVIWTTSIQDDIGLDISFSDSNIIKNITQGNLGTTQNNIDDAGKTNIQLFKPGSSNVDYTNDYIGFIPSLPGAINTIQDVIDDINTQITDWIIEKDRPVTNQIRFTSVDNKYIDNIFKLIITDNAGTGTTLGNFSTGIGNATIDILGSAVPNYYGLRSVTLANKDVFSNTASDYSWFETTKNTLGTIFPGYKVATIKTPEFAFDGISNGSASLVDDFFDIIANSNGQYVIDTETLTVSEIYNIPVDAPDIVISGSEMIYYSTKIYLAYRVSNDTDITGLSLGASDTGATIYTNKGSTYTITDSNTDVLVAEYIYKWNGTAWVKQT